MTKLKILDAFLGSLLLLISFTDGLSATEAKDTPSMAVVLKSKGGYTKHFVKFRPETLPSSHMAAALRAKEQSGDHKHAGEVYYKNGEMRADSRYITTGHIVVRFNKGSEVDLKAFAAKYGLRLERTIGKRKSMAVFINDSEQNDIVQSNVLLNDSDVLSSQPDWVLPLKLY